MLSWMTPKPDPDEMDEPVKIDLDPEIALRGLLKVDPDSEPVPPLDTYVSTGPGDHDEWRITCRTCGWEIAGTDKRAEAASEAARAHRCQDTDQR